METKERRIRCDKFANNIIVGSEVKPAGKEFYVRFIHELTGMSLFCKTHGGALEGIALLEDFDKARQRWLGKTVYSIRRFINAYDSVTGNVTTRKVKFSDPLKVIDIRWGMTPLPPKPLWLIVETVQEADAQHARASLARGFIPVCISWANVMLEKKGRGQPWDEDLMEQDPKKLYSWDNAVWDAIDNHSVISGMTTLQVRFSWGLPKIIRKDDQKNKINVQYLYDNGQVIYFVNDSLVFIDGK
jgi:hypothetical protein